MRCAASTGIAAPNICFPPRPGRSTAGGIAPIPSRSRSAPAKIAITPGIFAAAATSIERIVPWPIGARTNAACAAPDGARSSVKRPRPQTSGSSSLRSASRPLPNRRVSSAIVVSRGIGIGNAASHHAHRD